MKRNLFYIIGMTIIGFWVVLSACQKDDTTPPVITIGPPEVYLSLNHRYIDSGATAYDNKDGALAVTISGKVDNNTKGDYTITYYATDNSGNTGVARRVVHVVNDAEPWAATYAVIDSNATTFNSYSEIITSDFHINNKIRFSEFADYSANDSIYAMISLNGDTISIPSQTANGIGPSFENHTFNGSGLKSGGNFNLIFDDKNNSQFGIINTLYSTYTRH